MEGLLMKNRGKWMFIVLVVTLVLSFFSAILVSPEVACQSFGSVHQASLEEIPLQGHMVFAIFVMLISVLLLSIPVIKRLAYITGSVSFIWLLFVVYKLGLVIQCMSLST